MGAIAAHAVSSQTETISRLFGKSPATLHRFPATMPQSGFGLSDDELEAFQSRLAARVDIVVQLETGFGIVVETSFTARPTDSELQDLEEDLNGSATEKPSSQYASTGLNYPIRLSTPHMPSCLQRRSEPWRSGCCCSIDSSPNVSFATQMTMGQPCVLDLQGNMRHSHTHTLLHIVLLCRRCPDQCRM